MVETIKYASVSIEEVIAAKLRLEANVFNVEGKKAKEVLKNCKWEVKTLCGKNGVAKAYHRGRFKRIFVEKSDFPIFQPAQILELYPKPYKYISDLTKTDIEALRVKKGQILMSCSGTIGKCIIATKIFDNQIFSHDLLRINANDKEDIGFIYVYLITDIGQNLIKTNNYGAVIQHIEPEHLDFVQIPYPDKKIRQKISQVISQSFDFRDQANDLIDEAESILIKELQLPPIDELSPDFFDNKAEVRTFTVRLELLNNRFEGSYHNPIVSSILDCFLDSAESIKPLSNLSKEITMPGIFKRIYVDEENGVPFLGTNDILEINPRVEKFLSKVGHKKLIEKELSVKENTILITDRGTIGNVVLVPEYYEKESWTVSQNSIRIVPNSNDIAGYIYIFLNSDYGKALSKRETYGAVIDMIDPSNAGQIPIPILKNKDAMKKINDLALKANKLRAEAYYKEKEAIKIMNDEVIYATED